MGTVPFGQTRQDREWVLGEGDTMGSGWMGWDGRGDQEVSAAGREEVGQGHVRNYLLSSGAEITSEGHQRAPTHKKRRISG